jgi:hypothetical protein
MPREIESKLANGFDEDAFGAVAVEFAVEAVS